MSVQSGVLIKPFTEEEDVVIRQNYDKVSARKLAELLGRTKNSVIGRAHRLGLGRSRDETKIVHTVLRIRKIKAQTPHNPVGKRKSILPVRPAKPSITTGKKNIIVPESQRIATPLNGVGVHIVDLKPNHCRWVLGEPSALTYCGSNKIEGSAYCGGHHYESVRKE
jgi:hypothetical protein